MKRIACFTDSLTSGGAQRQLVGLATLLKKKGYDVDVITYYNIPFYKNHLDKNNISNFVIQVKNPILRIIMLLKFFLLNKYDTIIAYQETPSIIACILKFILRWNNLIVSERNTTQCLSYKEKIKFFLFRFADYIITNSNSQYQFINRHYPQYRNKLYCITNFVDTNKFDLSSNSIENRELPTILTVARIAHQKNILNYIKAIAILKNKGWRFRAIWVGANNNDQYFHQCLNLIKELDLNETFVIQNATKDIVNEYHNANLFCLPSTYEGFPNVICEAMSCGLPIACGDICDNGHIVTDEKGGYFFDPTNPEDIANKLERLLQCDSEEFKSMSKFNRKEAIEKFSAEKFISKYINLINNEQSLSGKL